VNHQVIILKRFYDLSKTIEKKFTIVLKIEKKIGPFLLLLLLLIHVFRAKGCKNGKGETRQSVVEFI
jgi:hypothetical protein